MADVVCQVLFFLVFLAFLVFLVWGLVSGLGLGSGKEDQATWSPLIGWLADWLADWQAGRLTGCLVGWLTGWWVVALASNMNVRGAPGEARAKNYIGDQT